MKNHSLESILNDPMQGPVVRDIFEEVFERIYSDIEILNTLKSAPDLLLSQLSSNGIRSIKSVTLLGDFLESIG